MGYRVIHFFTDLQDSNHAYNVGDAFPRIGMTVTEARLKELSGSKNKQNKPLIVLEDDKSVEEANTEEKNKYTKTDINRMSTSELKDLAKSVGFENTEEMTGADLKKNLIEFYNL